VNLSTYRKDIKETAYMDYLVEESQGLHFEANSCDKECPQKLSINSWLHLLHSCWRKEIQRSRSSSNDGL